MSTINIIGAGLSGLALALALQQQGMTCVVYEPRPAPLNIGGAVMLSPNALRVTHALGLYDNIKSKGFNFDVLHCRDAAGNLAKTYEFGSQEKYGFQALRIYRHILIDAFVKELKTRNIPDAPDGVTFAFTDGTMEPATLLVGADGIHSKVRRHLYPDLVPNFIGMAGITAAVPMAQVKLTDHDHIPATIVSLNGAFVIAPPKPDGSEVLIGKQRRITEQEPGWEKAPTAKEDAIRFLQQGNEHLPDFVRNAPSRIRPEKMNIWPFFIVPRLDR